jgi:predicted  nucleic acid-binding Zn-ribbon protein
MPKVCAHCGVDFEAKDRRALYCCKLCKSRAKYVNNIERRRASALRWRNRNLERARANTRAFHERQKTNALPLRLTRKRHGEVDAGRVAGKLADRLASWLER